MNQVDQFSEKEKQLIRDKAVTAKTGKPAVRRQPVRVLPGWSDRRLHTFYYAH